MTTIEEGKQFLRDNWDKGTECPCCNQTVKLYSRKIYSTMAANLIRLYKLDQASPNGPGDYFHVSDFCPRHPGDFAKFIYWGLAVERDNEDTDKRTSGMWAITERGRQFVQGHARVIEYVQIFNKKKYGAHGKMVSIRDALGTKFNYEELIG